MIIYAYVTRVNAAKQMMSMIKCAESVYRLTFFKPGTTHVSLFLSALLRQCLVIHPLA